MEIWDHACKQANEMQLEPAKLPRQGRRPPRRIDDGSPPCIFSDPASYHKVTTWFSFLDTISNEIRQRFLSDGFAMVVKVEQLLMHAANGQEFETEVLLVTDFYDEFEHEILAAQLTLLKQLFANDLENVNNVHIMDIVEIGKALQDKGAHLLMNEVNRLVKLCMVIPASSATAE